MLPSADALRSLPDITLTVPADEADTLPVITSTWSATRPVRDPPDSTSTFAPTATFTSSPADILIDSSAAIDRPLPPTVTSSADSIVNAPVDTRSISRVCRDRDSVASTYARPVTKLALSPAKARTAPPAFSSAVSVASDTESPEYAEIREPARTFTSLPVTASTSATSIWPDSASIDSVSPDDTDIEPYASTATDPAETEARPPLKTSIEPAVTDTRSDSASRRSTDSTLTTSPIT